MEIIVQEQGKLVTVWLNRKEQEDSALRERLKSLYAGYAEKNTRLQNFSPAEKNYTATLGICCSTIAASWQKRRCSGKSWQPCHSPL